MIAGGVLEADFFNVGVVVGREGDVEISYYCGYDCWGKEELVVSRKGTMRWRREELT